MQLMTLFYVFFKIGLFAFGGGYAMLPIMYESVQVLGFADIHEFANLLAVAQISPGALGINAAMLVGYNTSGVLGAIVASISVMLPSLIIIFVIARFYDKYKKSRIVEGIVEGIRPVTIGLIAASIIFVGKSSLFITDFTISNIMDYGYRFFNVIPLCIFAVALVLNGKFKLNPVIILILSGLVGAFLL